MEFLKKFKSNIFILAIFSVCSIIMIFTNLVFTRYIHFSNIMVSLVPVILYSISLYISVKYNKVIKWTRFSNLLNLVIFISLTVINFINMSFNDSSYVINDYKKYSRVLRVYNHEKNNLINHFPKSIPKDAKDIEFYEVPKMLSEKSKMYLSYKTSKENFNKILTDQNFNEKDIVSIKNINKNVNDIPKVVKDFLEKEKSEKNFIYLIKDKNIDGDANLGIAFNYGDNSIMYWSEK